MAKTDFLSHILIIGSKVYPGLALACAPTSYQYWLTTVCNNIGQTILHQGCKTQQRPKWTYPVHKYTDTKVSYY